MIKALIELLGSKIKKKELSIDNDIEHWMFIEFVICRIVELIRGLKLLFRLRFPRMLLLGRNVQLSYINRIYLGSGISIGNYSHLSGFGSEGLFIGNGVSIGDFCKLIVSTNYSILGKCIQIDDGVGIGDYSRIGGSGGVHIGKNTIIANYFSAHPENHIYSNLDVPIKQQETERKEIRIGEDCWIGAKVTVLAGVSIGKHCVVGAGSVVTKSIPDYSIAVGVPAKIIGTRLKY